MMQSACLAMQGLSKNFKQGLLAIKVLEDINISFKQASSYAITGVSGTGKSTFMHLLAGLDKPSAGAVVFNGKNIASMNDRERNFFLNKQVGLVFQQPYLIRELCVQENIMVPGMIAGLSHEACLQRAQELLEAVQLSSYAQAKPSALSGGQQQRVALARALFNKPVFLLADELTGNLDRALGQKIIALLLDLQKKYHMGIIISTHDAHLAHAMQEQFEIKEHRVIKL